MVSLSKCKCRNLLLFTSNHVNEGADMSDTGVTATSRLGNYHQISQKGYIVSNTLDAVDKAGRDREVAYQRVLKDLSFVVTSKNDR